MQRIVYYHKGCPDGFGSAWAFYKKYKDTAKYIPFTYGNKIFMIFLDQCDIISHYI